jgi:hypothetical protein
MLTSHRPQYTIPRKNMPALSEVFRLMEVCRQRHSLEDYSVSQTSLDSVFCKFADMQDSERADQPDDVRMVALDDVLVGEDDASPLLDENTTHSDGIESVPLLFTS